MTTAASTPMVDGRRVLVRALALMVLAALLQVPGIFALAWPLPLEVGLSLAAEVLSRMLVFSFGLALIFGLYDRRKRFEEPRPAAIGTILSALLYAVACGRLTTPTVSMQLGVVSSVEAFHLHSIWLNLVEASMALVFVMQREGSRTAEAQVRQHALQWRLARRRADEVAAHTALMRLEPRLLFETLRTARSTYLVDPERADASLEALTIYLRAVLQTSKAGRATFGDEIDLATARLRLGDLAQAVDLNVAAEASARAYRIPAGVLAPLLYRCAEALLQNLATQPSIVVAASVEGALLVVRVDAPSLPPNDVLDGYRLQIAAAAGKAPDDVMRVHGGGNLTLYFGDPDDA